MRKTLVAIALAAVCSAAQAGPTIQFFTSTGVNPADVGTITLTQINASTVDILVDLNDTDLPLPRYGFMNTGGPHTPFVFNVAGLGGLTANFIQPPGGVFDFGLLTLSGPGDATPFGTFGVSIVSSAGNGSVNAYYGDLEFELTRLTGLDTLDFVSNGTAYFAADLTDGASNTGSQAWNVPVSQQCAQPPCTRSVPEPTPLALAGLGFLALAWSRRRS